MTLSRLGMRQLAAVLLGLLICVTCSGNASANCSAAPTVTVTPAPATMPNYDPFTTAQTLSLTVMIKNNGNAACGFSLSFARAAIPASMANGISSLGYAIVGNGIQVEYISGTPPTASQRIDFLGVAKGATVSQTVTITTAAGQFVPAGSYTDTNVSADVYDDTANTLTPWSYTLLNMSETVLPVCNMPAPSVTSMNFTSAITNGLPNPGVTQTSTISNTQCTAPSGLQLSGTTLERTPVGSGVSGFDNFINWTATATYGSATATFTTTGPTTAPPVLSAAKNGSAGATNTGTISITNVHLIAGHPALAGSYSGVLTIQVDPSL